MRWVLAVALVGCYSPTQQLCAISCSTNSECPGNLVCAGRACTAPNTSCGDGGVIDPDAPVDAPILDDGCAGLPNGLVPHLCLDPISDRTLASSVDTDQLPCDFALVPGACVISALSIAVPLSTSVIGSRPLILWSSTTIEISGTLDASSHIFGKKGPGAGATAAICTNLDGAEVTTTAPDIGGGGAGGTYGSAGGRGGDGRNSVGVAGNSTLQPLIPIGLHGGCSGGNGGITPGGGGGAGGGAVYLMAHDSITVTGSILTSGAGGFGGGNGGSGVETGGGGGGGAGGLIAFDAPTVDLGGATLISLGGGGGGGAGQFVISMSVVVQSGEPGNDPTPTQVGRGGTAAVADNIGGDGSSLLGALGQDGGDVNAGAIGGGAGGGGGAGVIVRYGVAKLGGANPTSHPPLMQQ